MLERVAHAPHLVVSHHHASEPAAAAASAAAHAVHPLRLRAAAPPAVESRAADGAGGLRGRITRPSPDPPRGDLGGIHTGPAIMGRGKKGER